MFINPLQNSTLFITPKTVQDLTDIADSMSNSSEAWRMMVFTMNYCHYLVQREMREAEAREEEHRILLQDNAPIKNN
jgi:Asp-tRNA(Asn)/Glu-tRNA(Gln) amidotransferase C subunit